MEKELKELEEERRKEGSYTGCYQQLQIFAEE